MKNSFLSGKRVLGALFVLALMVPLATPVFSVKSDSVRTFVTCMKTCNALKDSCDASCQPGCDVLFPADPAGNLACVQSCSTSCARLMQNCKGACKFEKTGKTPHLPS